MWEGTCVGFIEGLVLKLKPCFMERDMKQILIEKSRQGVVYHHRDCSKQDEEHGVSITCYQWFNSLQDSEIELDESVGKNFEDTFDASEDQEPTANIKDVRLSSSQNTAHGKLDCSERHANEQKWFDICDVVYDDPDLQQEKRSDSVEKNVAAPKQKRSKRQTQEYICEVEGCSESSFPIKAKLREHMKKVHDLPKRGRKPILPPVTVPEGETKCDVCSKEFSNQILLIRHIRRHIASQQPCHICGQMVKYLPVHIKMQHTEKDKLRYFCEMCGRAFRGYSSYKFHLAGHTGERKYVCETCKKPYRTSSEQKKCEKAHQGLFKWNCGQCSFRAHQKNKFVRHLRTHTKSEPFNCPLCDYRFARKDYLQKHISKVHQEVSLEEVERLYPDMYKIKEKVSFVEGQIIVSSEEEQTRVLPMLPEDTPQIYLVEEQSEYISREDSDVKKKNPIGGPEWKIIIDSIVKTDEND